MFTQLKAQLQKDQFLFVELTKRDFKQKYKRTVLGVGWSMLSPLLTLLVMRLVFTQFFGRDTPNYTTYLFSGNLVMSFYREATKGGMSALANNASLFSKINLPKYLFVLSKNVSSMINFAIILVVYFFFCAIDGIVFGPHMFMLVYPVLCLTLMNIGIGMILSAVYVFFKDTLYLYDIFLTLLTYLSAIFYQVSAFSESVQRLFLMNPVYCCIKYFRLITIDGQIPSLAFHLLLAFYVMIFLGIGVWFYKKYNKMFIYYI